ncbi:hypothetical protein ACI68E_003702 [Malassezia pachydermatis]|uniref:Uncharacterized protein n=1 Tax=Malassezia pachydermatis TaxID=77020 RepID=A0A0M8MT96_9BASI|nr:hypothetical protein Malapachy_0258 [Malassezia pachydermatis]KOS13330.1 hypothetical protein Malapachy_0258 [Malassezia pachydermatis]
MTTPARRSRARGAHVFRDEVGAADNEAADTFELQEEAGAVQALSNVAVAAGFDPFTAGERMWIAASIFMVFLLTCFGVYFSFGVASTSSSA